MSALPNGARSREAHTGEALNEGLRANGAWGGDASHGLREEAPSSERGGGLDALDVKRIRRLADVLERLDHRVEGLEQRNAIALMGMDRSVTDLGRRVDRAEDDVRAEAESIRAALADVKDLHASLHERLARMEGEPAAQRALRVLATLEQRLDRLAQQQYDSDARTAADVLSVRTELDRRASALANDLANLDTEFDAAVAALRATVAAFGGRIEDVASGQRRLEDNVSGVSAALENLTAAVDAVDARERRNSDEARGALMGIDGAIGRIDQAQARVDEEIARIAATIEALGERQRSGEDVSLQLQAHAKALAAKQAELTAVLSEQEGKILRRMRVLDDKASRLDEEQQDLRDMHARTLSSVSGLAGALEQVSDRARAIEAENAAHASTLRDVARRQDDLSDQFASVASRTELVGLTASLADLSREKDQVAADVANVSLALAEYGAVQRALAEQLEAARQALAAAASRQDGLQASIEQSDHRQRRAGEETREALVGLDAAVARLDEEQNRTSDGLNGLAAALEALTDRQRSADGVLSDLQAQTLAITNRQDELLGQIARRDAVIERRVETMERAGLRLEEGQAELRVAQERLAGSLNGVAAGFEELSTRTRALETGATETSETLAEAVARQETLAQAIERRADRSAFEALVETVAALRDAHAKLGGDTLSLTEATEALAQRADAIEADARSTRQFLDGLKSETHAALADLEARLSEAREAEARAIQEVRDQIAQTNADVEHRFEAHEARIAGLDGALAAEVERLSARADAAEQRLHVAERTQSEAMRALQGALAGLAEKNRHAADSAETAEQISSLQAELEAKLALARAEIQAQIEARLATTTDAEGQQQATDDAIAQISGRLAAAERRSAQTVEAVASELKNLTAAFEARLAALETARAASAVEGGVSEDLLSQIIADRVSEGENRISALMSEALAHVGARVDQVERRAFEATAPLSAGVDRFSERLEALELRLRSVHDDARSPEPALPLSAVAPSFLAHAPGLADEDDRRFGIDAARLDAATDAGEPPWSDAREDSWRDDGADEPLGTALANEPVFTQADDRAATEDSIDDHLLADPPPLPPELFDPPKAAPEKPASGNDYLAQARKAAQASAAPTSRRSLAETILSQARARPRMTVAAGAAVAAVAGAYFGISQSGPADDDAAAAEAPPPAAKTGATVVARAGPVAELEKAARAGDAIAQYELGVRLAQSGDQTEAARLMRAAADQDLAMAQYRLAKFYERGQGVPRNIEEAREWTEKAANAGNRKAMHDLGVYYARGEGARQDDASAFRWFREAASFGVVDSQFNLGVLYEQGRGAPREAREALFWFLVAAAGGDGDAAKRAQALAQELPPGDVERIQARAQRFQPKPVNAAANGDFGPSPWSSTAVAPG